VKAHQEANLALPWVVRWEDPEEHQIEELQLRPVVAFGG
jgi:hypothetical protein